MDLFQWFDKFVFDIPAIRAIFVIGLCCAIGLSLGKIKMWGFSFGVTCVFFVGILLGSMGIGIDHNMLLYAEDVGLVIFVYVLGLQVGPGFVSSFRSGGKKLSLLSIGLIVTGTIMAVVPILVNHVPLGEMMGVLCGATTNTPALAACQQTFTQLHHLSYGIDAALSLAVTYPIGMVGVIIALAIVKNFLRKKDYKQIDDSPKKAFIASFEVKNPAIFGKTIADCCSLMKHSFVVSRIWRSNRVILPESTTRIECGDHLLIVTEPKDLQDLTILFGEVEDRDWNKSDIDWNALDSKFVSMRVLVTQKNINGHSLGSLHLRNRFGVNISRVDRAGIQLVATRNLVMRIGDRVTVVGEKESCKRVAEVLGDRVRVLDEPNLVTIFIGVVLGLVLGYLPIVIPGISTPLRLGLAGGPIIMGILIGAYGPRLHMVTYVTTSANLLIRSLGLATYLACLGLDAGPEFVNVVMRPVAWSWIAYSLCISVIPVIIFAYISMKWFKCSFVTASGMLCGAMANPIALDYINETEESDKASVAYATVYPLGMFLRVIIAQLLVMMWLG